jgi:DNA-binding protein
MDKYRRVPQPKESLGSSTDDSVVTVQAQGKIVQYVSYAVGLLENADKSRVEIVGMGRSINKAVTVGEVIRRKVDDVHQLTTLTSVVIKDRYEPLEEGLDVCSCALHFRSVRFRALHYSTR